MASERITPESLMLTKEEKEMLLNRKIEAMKLRNQEILREHQEKENDRKMAEQSGRSVTLQKSSGVGNRQTISSERSTVGKSLDEGSREGEGQTRRSFGAGGKGKQSSRSSHIEIRTSGPSKYETSNGNSRLDRANSATKEGPPADPPSRFLYDPARVRDDPGGPISPVGERPDSVGGPRGRGARRHPRNYGGESFEKAAEMVSQKKYKKPGSMPSRTDPEYKLVTTGKERREDEEWKKERDRVDAERLRRHRNTEGAWKREWDQDKERLGDTPPQGWYQQQMSPQARQQQQQQLRAQLEQQRQQPGESEQQQQTESEAQAMSRRPAGRIGSGRFVAIGSPGAVRPRSKLLQTTRDERLGRRRIDTLPPRLAKQAMERNLHGARDNHTSASQDRNASRFTSPRFRGSSGSDIIVCIENSGESPQRRGGYHTRSNYPNVGSRASPSGGQRGGTWSSSQRSWSSRSPRGGRGGSGYNGQGGSRFNDQDRPIGVAVIRTSADISETADLPISPTSPENKKPLKSILKNKELADSLDNQGAIRKGKKDDDEDWEDIEVLETRASGRRRGYPSGGGGRIRRTGGRGYEEMGGRSGLRTLGVATITTSSRSVDVNTAAGEIKQISAEKKSVENESVKQRESSDTSTSHTPLPVPTPEDKNEKGEPKVVQDSLKSDDIAEDDDGEWEDIDEDYQPGNTDTEDDDNEESFEKFVRDHTLTLDVNVGVKVGSSNNSQSSTGSHGQFSPDSSFKATTKDQVKMSTEKFTEDSVAFCQDSSIKTTFSDGVIDKNTTDDQGKEQTSTAEADVQGKEFVQERAVEGKENVLSTSENVISKPDMVSSESGKALDKPEVVLAEAVISTEPEEFSDEARIVSAELEKIPAESESVSAEVEKVLAAQEINLTEQVIASAESDKVSVAEQETEMAELEKVSTEPEISTEKEKGSAEPEEVLEESAKNVSTEQENVASVPFNASAERSAEPQGSSDESKKVSDETEKVPEGSVKFSDGPEEVLVGSVEVLTEREINSEEQVKVPVLTDASMAGISEGGLLESVPNTVQSSSASLSESSASSTTVPSTTSSSQVPYSMEEIVNSPSDALDKLPTTDLNASTSVVEMGVSGEETGSSTLITEVPSSEASSTASESLMTAKDLDESTSKMD